MEALAWHLLPGGEEEWASLGQRTGRLRARTLETVGWVSPALEPLPGLLPRPLTASSRDQAEAHTGLSSHLRGNPQAVASEGSVSCLAVKTLWLREDGGRLGCSLGLPACGAVGSGVGTEALRALIPKELEKAC